MLPCRPCALHGSTTRFHLRAALCDNTSACLIGENLYDYKNMEDKLAFSRGPAGTFTGKHRSGDKFPAVWTFEACLKK